ncbi:MAG: dUTP diphosphatase [Patescibacteria group bacterium]|nr:dUTP diphosphatase [Patescibacteria group bacterium]
MKIPVKRFDKTLPLPQYDHGAACFDLLCREDSSILPREIKLISTNIAIQIPQGYALLIFVRSSTPMKKGLILANSVGIVDPFYQGDKDEVLIEFMNIRDEAVEIKKGEKLAQAMLIKSESVEWDEKEEFNEKGVGGYKTDW